MPATKKIDNDIRYGGGATLDDSVKVRADDPFIAKKVAEAKIAISKLVFPETAKK